MRRYKRVEIEWNDASHWGSMASRKETLEECHLIKMRTIGYLLKRGKKTIIVAGEYNEDNLFRDRSIISRADVTRITYLEGE